MGINQSALDPNVLEEVVVLGKRIIELLEQGPTKPCPMPEDISSAEEEDKKSVSQAVVSLLHELPKVSPDPKILPHDTITPSKELATASSIEAPTLPRLLTGGVVSKAAAGFELRSKAHKQIVGLDTMEKYNFAFVGCVGAGKSTLINSLRGIFKPNNPQYAPVGEGECTQRLKSYVHPKYKSVVFWDFPGGGTDTRPMKDYFYKQKMYAFDHIIIVFADRITQLDFNIAHAAKKHKVPYNFIRSKADLDIDSREKNMKYKEVGVKSCLHETIQNDFIKQCRIAGMADENKVYIVSQFGFDTSNEYAEMYSMDENELLRYVLQTSLQRRNE